MMPPDYHYTTAFGASIDIEIGAAIKAGMPLEKIATELGHRYGELFDAIVAKRRFEESKKCAA